MTSPVAHLEKRTMKQLLSTSDDWVLVLILPLQSFREAFHESSQGAASETLKECTH